MEQIMCFDETYPARSWRYTGKQMLGGFRLIAMDGLLAARRSLSLFEWSNVDWTQPTGAPKYVAISHVWEPSEEVARISNLKNQPLLIDVGDRIHKISWYGLVQAAVAAKHLDCSYIWLDLICVDQLSRDDKKLQIKNMGHIYENATAVLVMCGGVSAAQRLDKYANWIDRAWTLQEATLCANTRCLVEWPFQGSVAVHGTEYAFFEKLDGNIAIVELSQLLEFSLRTSHKGVLMTPDGSEFEFDLDTKCLGGQRVSIHELRSVISARADLLEEQKSKSPSESESESQSESESESEEWETESDSDAESCSDSDSQTSRKGDRNKAAALYTPAWRSMWLRTSTKPQDMVFSMMHLLGVQIEVDYSRTQEELLFELANKVEYPGWLIIGHNIPINPRSGLMPIVPKFVPQSIPTYQIQGTEYPITKFVSSLDYIEKFDIVVKSSSMDGHEICGQIFCVDNCRKARYGWRKLDISNQIKTFKAEVSFKGEIKVGDLVVILGEEGINAIPSLGNWGAAGPMISLLRNQQGVWLKVGNGTIKLEIKEGRDRRHLRIGGSSGACLMPCNCDG
jgi:hypothetical protein